MSLHIAAVRGDIAPTVLMPGDPLRRRWIAREFLTDARCYTEVRGMLGFTGTWRGQPVSVQGSGMGQPSLAIYATELFGEYDVQQVIRVGSCGAASDRVRMRDLVIASGACTDSSLTKRLVAHGVLAVEMEACALYTLAAAHQRRALAICTVSDHLLTGEGASATEREQSFGDMVTVALTAALEDAPPAG